MDLISQVKMADVMMKFLRGDMARLTPYPFAAGKPAFAPDGDPRLPRSTPEREGIPSGYLREFFRAADDGSFPPKLHSAAVLCHGKLVACVSREPYTAQLPHMTFSFGKTVVAMAVGLAAEEGLLSAEDKVVSFFPEKQPPLFRSPRMAAMTVRHLLTMTSGANFNEAGSEIERDWVRAFFFSDCSAMPGESFRYNSMNSYLLAAILCRVTGQTLVEYLTPRLFEPLGIGPVYWETCPMGIEKGGWGLYLRVTDMAKLGQLCLNGGVWEGRRVLPERWLAEMLTLSVDTGEEGMERYGYQLWGFPAPHSYQFNGVFGQYAVVLPEYDMVIASTGGDSGLFYNRILRAIDEYFGSGAPARFAAWRQGHPECGVSRLCRDPLREDRKALALLRDPWSEPEPEPGPLRRLASRLRAPAEPKRELPAAALRFCAAKDAQGSSGDGWYRLGRHTGSLLPFVLSGLTNNFAPPVSALRFFEEDGRFFVSFALGGEGEPSAGVVTLEAGTDGTFARGTAAVNGEPYAAAARASFRRDEDDRDVLLLDVCLLEAPCVRRFKIIRTGADSLYVRLYEFPGVMECAKMLLSLVGGEETPGTGWRQIGQDILSQKLMGRVKEIALPKAAAKKARR